MEKNGETEFIPQFLASDTAKNNGRVLSKMVMRPLVRRPLLWEHTSIRPMAAPCNYEAR